MCVIGLNLPTFDVPRPHQQLKQPRVLILISELFDFLLLDLVIIGLIYIISALSELPEGNYFLNFGPGVGVFLQFEELLFLHLQESAFDTVADKSG